MERLSFRRFIPNIFTFVSLTLGVTSIKFAFESRWEISVGFIVFASFLDNLDGKFILHLIKNEDWDNPMVKLSTKDLSTLKFYIKTTIDYISTL